MLTIYNVKNPVQLKNTVDAAHGDVSIALDNNISLSVKNSTLGMEILEGLSTRRVGVKVKADDSRDMSALLHSLM